MGANHQNNVSQDKQRQSRDSASVPGGSTKMAQLTFVGPRLVASLAVTVMALVGGGGSEWGVQSANANPREPYERLLPLELSAPAKARAGQPLVGISVRLHNPGAEAPNSRLRLIIHEKDHGPGGHHELNPDNVKVEVLEGGLWKPVLLGITDGGVMGAIGSEEVAQAQHRERHKRGGFEIREGFNKRWPLRVTFGLPGTYTLLVAVSPDNGSRHLAQPAHADIEVQ